MDKTAESGSERIEDKRSWSLRSMLTPEADIRNWAGPCGWSANLKTQHHHRYSPVFDASVAYILHYPVTQVVHLSHFIRNQEKDEH